MNFSALYVIIIIIGFSAVYRVRVRFKMKLKAANFGKTVCRKYSPLYGQEYLMFNPDLFTVLELTKVENPNLFPFPFELHIGFSIIAFLFFMVRYFFDKRPYQLILSFAIPFSMTLWLSENKVWFYTVGAIEFALILISIVSDIIYKIKHPELKAEKKSKEENSAEKKAE